MGSVTLDSNIYVSALEFGGIGARILGMAREDDKDLLRLHEYGGIKIVNAAEFLKLERAGN